MASPIALIGHEVETSRLQEYAANSGKGRFYFLRHWLVAIKTLVLKGSEIESPEPPLERECLETTL